MGWGTYIFPKIHLSRRDNCNRKFGWGSKKVILCFYSYPAWCLNTYPWIPSGPTYEALFCPIIVDFKGSFNLYLKCRVSHSFSIKEYISDIYAGLKFLQNLKTLTDTHCSYLLCTGSSQFMVLNSFIPMWDLFSRFKQKRIHLFWAVCIFFCQVFI